MHCEKKRTTFGKLNNEQVDDVFQKGSFPTLKLKAKRALKVEIIS